MSGIQTLFAITRVFLCSIPKKRTHSGVFHFVSPLTGVRASKTIIVKVVPISPRAQTDVTTLIRHRTTLPQAELPDRTYGLRVKTEDLQHPLRILHDVVLQEVAGVGLRPVISAGRAQTTETARGWRAFPAEDLRGVGGAAGEDGVDGRCVRGVSDVGVRMGRVVTGTTGR